jgi:hypothetical protein
MTAREKEAAATGHKHAYTLPSAVTAGSTSTGGGDNVYDDGAGTSTHNLTVITASASVSDVGAAIATNSVSAIARADGGDAGASGRDNVMLLLV